MMAKVNALPARSSERLQAKGGDASQVAPARWVPFGR